MISKVKHRKIGYCTRHCLFLFQSCCFYLNVFVPNNFICVWLLTIVLFVTVFCPVPFKSKLVILIVWVGVYVCVCICVRAKFNLDDGWFNSHERNSRALDVRSNGFDLQGEKWNNNERRFIQNQAIFIG